MRYLQVSLTAEKNHAEAISAILEGMSSLSIMIESANDEACFDTAEPGQPKWALQRITALYPEEFDTDNLLTDLYAHPHTNGVSTSWLEDQDWERSWLDQFEPINVGRDLWICPSWKDPIEPEAVNLIIDPGLAFGTGRHPTTHLCLESLSKQVLKGKTVIDYGCGSGILAIAALKLGAVNVIGVDIDLRALSTSRENANRNGVEGRLTVCLPDEAPNATYDVVIANILAGTLISLSDALVEFCRPDTLLMLSGILSSQSGAVNRCFSETSSMTETVSGDWVLLEGMIDSPESRFAASVQEKESV